MTEEPRPDEWQMDYGMPEYRDPRLPSPAKVRWLKAYHKVKQLRAVSIISFVTTIVLLPIHMSW